METFRVAVHGNTVPLGKVAGATGKGDRIVVTLFHPAHIPAVIKALTEARLNAYDLNPRVVAVGIPPVSGEQRAEIARQVTGLGEEMKVAVRAIHQAARKQIAARGRGSKRAVQESF